MKTIVLGLVIMVGTATMVEAAPSSSGAGPAAPFPETCGSDAPMPCLNQHGESAAAFLAKIYADASAKLDTACSEVIAPGTSACLERAEAVADKALNDAYQHAMASIPAGNDGKSWRERLKASQQSWLHFRDADCGDLIVSETGSGSALGSSILACQLGKTEARTAELKRRYGGN